MYHVEPRVEREPKPEAGAVQELIHLLGCTAKASRTDKAKGGGGLGGDSLTDARASSDAASSAARPRKRLKGPLSDSRAQGGFLAAGKGQGMLQGRAEPSTPGPSNT